VARAAEARVLRDARPVGVVVRRSSLATLAIGVALLLPQRAAAQLPEAEDAFTRGDFRTARALYDSALALDSLNPRALYRLAVLDSWSGKLKRSLARFAVLRRVEPLVPDEMAAHARVLSWAGKLRWARALYDSILAIDSSRTDALAGQARMVAWGGDLNQAERMWRTALAAHPDDPEILVGLGQTLEWEGEPDLAETYVAQARSLAPSDRQANDLLSQVRAERRPLLSVTSEAANDIEHNRFVAFSSGLSALLRPALQGTLRASWRQNTDDVASARSSGVDAGLIRSLPPKLTLRGGVGVRALESDSGPSRTFVTAQLGAGLHPTTFLSIAANYTRSPFDETRLLVQHGFHWDEFGIDVDASPSPNFEVSGGLDAAWLSDGNRRLLGNAAVMMGVVFGLRAGVYGRVMGYRESPSPSRSYFAPDRFLLEEGRAVYLWRLPGWWMRTTAGLGVQQVGSAGPTQAEWHADAALGHNWGFVDEISLTATYTNSAAASTSSVTTTTYRYWSARLRYQRGF
jgi:tetratricopeptide (TPR) repeat protein